MDSNGTDAVISDFNEALWVEFRKVWRSKTFWLSIGIFAVLALVTGFFMFILKDPDLAHRLGLVGAKAEVFGGTADWSGLFNLILLLVTVGGMVIFGFLFVWIFGREYSDRTVYDMLALPVSRLTIISAKIFTVVVWSLALILMVFGLVIAFGFLLQLPGWSGALALNTLGKMMITGLLNMLLCAPFGIVASMTRSYLPAVGCIFLVLMLGEIFNTIGYGAYFPWAVPALYSGAAEAMTGAPHQALGMISYLLVGIVGLIGLVVTGVWWRYADQA